MTWLLLNTPPASAAYNMALDEALLEAVAGLERPVLRLYAWNEPAASFGYFQKIAEIEKATLLRPLIRRPTGGGLVPHQADWTYSLAFPPGHPWHALHARESYEKVHQWILRSLARLGFAAELAPCCRQELPGQCFAGYEQFDVLMRGRKIAGAAQRRTRSGLLIQGSLQPPPPSLARSDWEQSLAAVAAEAWGVEWRPLAPSAELEARVRELIAAKYARDDYNRRR